MVPHRRFLAAAALVTIAVQLTLSAAGTLVACANTPHTHNGLSAPDCPMHHSDHQTTPAVMNGHEHHHHTAQTQKPDGARLTCACSSDLPAFLIQQVGAIPSFISFSEPSFTVTTVLLFVAAPFEQAVAPLTPPPRPFLT